MVKKSSWKLLFEQVWVVVSECTEIYLKGKKFSFPHAEERKHASSFLTMILSFQVPRGIKYLCVFFFLFFSCSCDSHKRKTLRSEKLHGVLCMCVSVFFFLFFQGIKEWLKVKRKRVCLNQIFTLKGRRYCVKGKGVCQLTFQKGILGDNISFY